MSKYTCESTNRNVKKAQGVVSDSLKALVSLADAMEDDAFKFMVCSDNHEQRGNYGASAVAMKAVEILILHASVLREANDNHEAEGPKEKR